MMTLRYDCDVALDLLADHVRSRIEERAKAKQAAKPTHNPAKACIPDPKLKNKTYNILETFQEKIWKTKLKKKFQEKKIREEKFRSKNVRSNLRDKRF